MSSWGGSSSFIPKIGSSKKVVSLSKSKTTILKEEPTESLKLSLQELPEVEGKGKGRMEEPLYILQQIKQEQGDIDMEEDESFWQEATLKTMEMDELVDTETPRFESLSVNDEPSPKSTTTTTLKRKRVGEDVFTRESVKQWQGSRIKAWENRYMSPEGFYYRFVAPGEGQQNGGWSAQEQKLFMNRYNEWISKGYKIGSSWGLFSCGIPHRVGYQCMNYYRKLVSDGKLQDDSYITVDGKLKQTHKERLSGTVPNTELGPEWKDPEVKEDEKNIDQWLKEFHGRSGQSLTTPKPKPKVTTPRIVTKKRSNISDLVKKMPPKQFIEGEDDFMMMESEPEVAHLQARDWETEWNDRLQNYRKFLIDQYWYAKQDWRRSLITTELLLQKSMVKKTSQPPPLSTSSSDTPSKIQQSSLSRFFTGVKKRKVDTPDEFISHVRIPNDLYSGVKRIQPLSAKTQIDESKQSYIELNDINDCIPLLDDILQPATDASSLECILVDPPWEFYVADGKNDGSCTWNLMDFQKLIEPVSTHMTAGMIFVWSHKLIQADIVRIMYTMNCKYVENLVWFKKSVNNVQLDEPSPYFSSTKEILLMFKKGEGFELRHQRSPDVIIDFELPRNQWIHDEFTVPKPIGVYDMIETLLPRAVYDSGLKRGKFLELWAKKASPRREGWIAIHQNKP
ncbi:hypothetical protein INT48_009637 [Thamnidium elegans]|uniref:Uncharacterized protein n=1 Tax=Thamnidium elegans TaxID=101142 RepID=A0A8H7W3Z3_9FUNG|nr:hypothetical protein INT48_009637 [Thamnidium elegans]